MVMQPFLHTFGGFGWLQSGKRGKFVGKHVSRDSVNSKNLVQASNYFSSKLYTLANFSRFDLLGCYLDSTHTS